MNNSRTTLQKALSINQDSSIYGTFAEIGAGQEVARFFFQAGQASNTIAKTMSAYDMIYSDEIYGKEPSGRYVCESRLLKMLEKEFTLIQKRLSPIRGDKTKFFAFANTVATGDQAKRFTHGWMGLRFQTEPGGPANDIIMHVRLLDKHRLQQQEVLGILGVNLVATAFQNLDAPKEVIPYLVENIKQGQVLIDFIRFSGPKMSHLNNNIMNLSLVRRGLAEAVLFGPKKEILSISDTCYQKAILVQRGSFRPITNTHLDVVTKGAEQMKKDFPKDSKDLLVLFELTMNTLEREGHIDEEDFLERIGVLCDLGLHVMVSNFFLFYRLRRFLRQFSSKHCGIIMAASHLDRLFDEQHYKDLEGGLLEGMGKLLNEDTQLYIYPHKTKDSCMTTKTYFPHPKYLKIYQHFLETKKIIDISGCDETSEYIHSEDIRKMLESGNKQWKNLVPAKVREAIEKKNLFRER